MAIFSTPPRPHLLGLLLSLGLGACGSSGDGGETPPPPSGVITLTGVVSTTTPLAAAEVKVQCAAGEGRAVADAVGRYSVDIGDATLPCVLEASGSQDGRVVKMHSVAAGAAESGDTVAVNITPVTELLVAQVTHTDPATFQSEASASSLTNTLTSTQLEAAQAAVLEMLDSAGLSTATVGNVLTDTPTGDGAYATLLTALDNSMDSSGTSLETLTATVAATAAGSDGGNTDPVQASALNLPADWLLRPKAADCAALRTGIYRFLKAAEVVQDNPVEPAATTLVLFDAATLTWMAQDGTTQTWTATDTCRYQSDSGDTEVVVAPSGVMLMRTTAGEPASGYRMALALPEQKLNVADVAGRYNMLEWEDWSTADGSTDLRTYIIDIDTAGMFTGGKLCDHGLAKPENQCTAFTAEDIKAKIVTNTRGGFEVTGTDPADPFSDRTFAYRAGNGELLLVTLTGSGRMGFYTPYRALSLPQDHADLSWLEVLEDGNLTTTGLSSLQASVTGVQSSGQSFTQTVKFSGSSISHSQTFAINQARTGFRHRAAGTTTASNSSTINLVERYEMPLVGMGMSVVYLPSDDPALRRLGLMVQP